MASASGRRSRSSRRVSPPKSAELLRSDSQMQLCANLGLRLADGAGPRAEALSSSPRDGTQARRVQVPDHEPPHRTVVAGADPSAVLMAATASEPSEKVSLDNTPRQASLTLIRGGRDVDLAYTPSTAETAGGQLPRRQHCHRPRSFKSDTTANPLRTWDAGRRVS